MNSKSQVLKLIEKKDRISAFEIMEKTSLSHSYVHKILQNLSDEGLIYKSGGTKNAKYIIASPDKMEEEKENKTSYVKTYSDLRGLEEHRVLDEVRKKTSILKNVSKNTAEIFEYSFTEMLNNAIEHSNAKKLVLKAEKTYGTLKFDIRDYGIGIFNNIKELKRLNSLEEAIGELTKGKLTTAESGHTGEGIFFTSKAADTLTLQNANKKVVFNNLAEDIFVRTIREFKGTRVAFSLNLASKRKLNDIFSKYAGRDFTFDTSKVLIKLFTGGNKYISRSEARRVMNGLEKFRTIILDYKGIESVGQGF